MSRKNVIPIRPAPSPDEFDRREEAELDLTNALAIVNILQGAAAHGAIGPPANGEALARTLDVVRWLLDRGMSALLPDARS